MEEIYFPEDKDPLSGWQLKIAIGTLKRDAYPGRSPSIWYYISS